VYETDDAFVIELEAPGYEEGELELEVAGRRLKVTGARAESTETEAKSYRVQERLERRFERTFELPVDVDPESLRASFAKGVLEVRAPKVQATEPRKIQIEPS
jgi:HSP20 family protein